MPTTFGVRPVAVRFTVAAANSSWMRYPTKTESAALTLHVPSGDERLSASAWRVADDGIDRALGGAVSRSTNHHVPTPAATSTTTTPTDDLAGPRHASTRGGVGNAQAATRNAPRMNGWIRQK